MAAFKALVEWLDRSGCVNTLVNAEVATPGTAESFLEVSHLVKTRPAHAITASALCVLQQSTYDDYRAALLKSEVPLEFEVWSGEMASTQPQFNYWSQVLGIDVVIGPLGPTWLVKLCVNELAPIITNLLYLPNSNTFSDWRRTCHVSLVKTS